MFVIFFLIDFGLWFEMEKIFIKMMLIGETLYPIKLMLHPKHLNTLPTYDCQYWTVNGSAMCFYSKEC